MKTKSAVEFFETQQALAEALSIKQSSVAEWGEYPPELRQLQLQAITGGKLVAEKHCLRPATKKKPDLRKQAA